MVNGHITPSLAEHIEELTHWLEAHPAFQELAQRVRHGRVILTISDGSLHSTRFYSVSPARRQPAARRKAT
jgi:hypothetical protein